MFEIRIENKQTNEQKSKKDRTCTVSSLRRWNDTDEEEERDDDAHDADDVERINQDDDIERMNRNDNTK